MRCTGDLINNSVWPAEHSLCVFFRLLLLQPCVLHFIFIEQDLEQDRPAPARALPRARVLMSYRASEMTANCNKFLSKFQSKFHDIDNVTHDAAHEFFSQLNHHLLNARVFACHPFA